MADSEFNLGISIWGVIVAIMIFILVWIVGGVAMYFFDMARGLGDSMLQTVFRELFIPGVGGFAAMHAVLTWVERASVKVAFFGFSGFIFVLIGVNLGFVMPIADEAGISTMDLLLSFGSMVAAIGGAFYVVKDDL
jgi:hypothetical protein